jgi:type I restriction enzyme R subunit
MPITPEDKARQKIDKLLTDAGWIVQDRKDADLAAGRGVAVREFPLKSGHGEADYLLFVDQMAIGVVEAKREGETLTQVELQNQKYSEGVPDGVTAPRKPLPFRYESTAVETRFTNTLEPDARSRAVFAFHRPDTLAEWLTQELQHPGSTLRARLRHMPELLKEGLRPAQIKAILNLEDSLAANRPRALIQMASGGGKTYTACNLSYRLIRHAGARRVLFLVDRNNLGRQTLKEFQGFRVPDENRLFTELYNVQHMQSNKLDDVSRVCITTIQRLYSMLRGEELDPALEEESSFTASALLKEPVPVTYNPKLPIETFDLIITDECHRSIYNLWAQVLEYFDAFIIGLTATPSKQTFGFFNQNLVMEYSHDQAVADGVNVDFDLYRIRTLISEHGSVVNAGFSVQKRDRLTRAKRWKTLDDDLQYASNELDRDVVAPDQIRTIIRTFKERLFTEIFPGRREVPKTLIFAKDDSHAEDIVNIVREEFGKGNDFCQKITYRAGTIPVKIKKKTPEGVEVEETVWKSGGLTAEELLTHFRNSYNPRIAVTVDMIATGTDIRPLEIVFFLRSVRSRTFFEQMKGRGTRVITPDDLQQVTPDARAKTHFIIVDAVGLSEQEMTDTKPLERKRTVSFDKLMEAVAFGSREPDVLSSLASRLARLERELTQEEHEQITQVAGEPLTAITQRIVEALDPDVQMAAAQKATGSQEPTEEQIDAAATALLADAAKPIASNPPLRHKLEEIRKAHEQTIDIVSRDEVRFAGFDSSDESKLRSVVQSFEQFIREHKDEITALQLIYSRPFKQRPTPAQLRELAQALERPPLSLPKERLWEAYRRLERSRVRGSMTSMLTDLVSLVRFALQQQDELHPFKQDVDARFAAWIAGQGRNGKRFTEEQRQWLEAIRDHIAASLTIEPDDFEFEPFVQRGGLGRARQVFGPQFQPLLNELNEVLVA